MSMPLAELDAQEVTLLPERATLHRGSGISIHQTAIASVVTFGGFFNENTNVAVAAIVNL